MVVLTKHYLSATAPILLNFFNKPYSHDETNSTHQIYDAPIGKHIEQYMSP